MSDRDDRAQRLADALRTNLRRRKAQARAQDEAASSDRPAAPADRSETGSS